MTIIFPRPKLGLEECPANAGANCAGTMPQDETPNRPATAADNFVKLNQQLQNTDKTDSCSWLWYMASTYWQPQWELDSSKEEGAGDAVDNANNAGDGVGEDMAKSLGTPG
ncbi:hypothetical protein C0989_005005, partial [Termitomyces sp. Mn162]